MIHLFATWAPFQNPLVGPGYQWWSGAGSDFGELTLIASVLAVLGLVAHHLQCHEPSCRRIIRHRFHDHETGEVYGVCPRHHPARHHREPGHPLHRLHEQYHGAIGGP